MVDYYDERVYEKLRKQFPSHWQSYSFSGIDGVLLSIDIGSYSIVQTIDGVAEVIDLKTKEHLFISLVIRTAEQQKARDELDKYLRDHGLDILPGANQ